MTDILNNFALHYEFVRENSSPTWGKHKYFTVLIIDGKICNWEEVYCNK